MMSEKSITVLLEHGMSTPARPYKWCGRIATRMTGSFTIRNIRRAILKSLAIVLTSVLVGVTGCNPASVEEDKSDPILRDAYSFYVLDPGDFISINPPDWQPSAKEFLVLQDGEVELSCGGFPGAHIPIGVERANILTFARKYMESSDWLPGCWKFLIDSSEVSIGGRTYYTFTLLVRRDPSATGELTSIQRIVHQRELTRFPLHFDRIVRLYFAVNDRDIYILILSGPPEDMAAGEAEIRRLLASIRLNATQALAELGETFDGSESTE